ncbi:MAG: sulfatase [Planctomycetota bacterium]
MKHIAGLLLIALSFSAAAEPAKPNVVVIFTDDLGYRDLGCFGAPDIRTPRIDEMAREGMKFTEFYVASSICSPSRAALLTGCYPERVGVDRVFFPNRGQGGLPPEQVTVAEVLRDAGYATAAVGKWHLGDEPEFLPTNQGFDLYYGIPYSNDMFPARSMAYAEDCLFREGVTPIDIQRAFESEPTRKNPRSMRNKVPLMRGEACIEFPADQATLTRRYTDETIRFIDESLAADRPFFVYLAHTMPHVPLFTTPEFKGKSRGGLYGDVIEELDHETGRILDHLRELGIDEKTLVVFTSDNGPWLTRGDRAGSALPFFEGKFTRFEGGVRVPAVMWWPGTIPAGGTCTEPVMTIDLMPTITYLAGGTLPDRPVDGQDILGLVTAQPDEKSPHEYLFFGPHAVRWGDWKYHAKERFMVKETRREDSGPTLYHLGDDLGETLNVIERHPEVAEHLASALAAHVERIKSSSD